MDWSWKELAQIAVFAVVVGTALAIALLRLGGVIEWPGRGVAFAVLALILAPVIILLFAAAAAAAGEGADEPDLGLIGLLLPPWF